MAKGERKQDGQGPVVQGGSSRSHRKPKSSETKPRKHHASSPAEVAGPVDEGQRLHDEHRSRGKKPKKFKGGLVKVGEEGSSYRGTDDPRMREDARELKKKRKERMMHHAEADGDGYLEPPVDNGPGTSYMEMAKKPSRAVLPAKPKKGSKSDVPKDTPGHQKKHSRTASQMNQLSSCYLCEAEAMHAAEEGSTVAPRKKYFRLFENDMPEQAHGLAGLAVKRLGFFAYIIFILIPIAFITVMYAGVPLGRFNVATIKEQWVFLFITNSTAMAVISWLYVVAFRGMADVERPFRASLIPPIAVFVAETAIFAPILLTKGVFNLLALVSYAVCVVVTHIALYFTYPNLRSTLKQFILRFMTLLVFFIAVLTGYIVIFGRTENETVRRVLVPAMSFITFIYRRIMLSRLDMFPLNLSLIYSGFWVQNLNDIFQALAFPYINDPSTFAVVWISTSVGNFALIGFVTNFWVFKLRPWLKTNVKNASKCNFPIPPLPEPDFSFDPANRGHDENVGGYRRRQFRFFFWRLLSQFTAMIFYLTVAPMLRFGKNGEFTGVGIIQDKSFRNSMIYAGVNLLFIIGITLLGYFYVNKRHHPTFHEMREIHGHEYISHTFIGYNILIMTHNLILAVGVSFAHSCLLRAFEGCGLERIEEVLNPDRDETRLLTGLGLA